MYKLVNSKGFTVTWFFLSFLMLFYTSYLNFSLSLLFLLTFLDGISDIWLEHFYSMGISKRLTVCNAFANLLGITVQFAYGLYGGMVTSIIGFLLLSHKALTWDVNKDGRITSYRKQEFTLTTVGILIGIVVLGLFYGYFFRGSQPMWLIALNVLVFVLGTTARILLINGKVLAQHLYIARELIDLVIFIAMLSIGLAKGSFWIRLASILSSLIILFKALVNWTNHATKE